MKTHKIILSAGAETSVPGPVNFVLIDSASGSVRITAPDNGGDGGIDLEMVEGQSVKTKATHTKIIIRDISGSANTINLVVGNGEFNDSAGLVELSSATPGESIWNPDNGGGKPRVDASGKLFVYPGNTTIFTTYDYNVVAMRPGDLYNKVQKRAGYWRMHNENALIHGVPSDKVSEIYGAMSHAPASGKYAYGQLGNNLGSGLLVFIDEIYTLEEAYVMRVSGTGGGGTVTTQSGGNLTADELTDGVSSTTPVLGRSTSETSTHDIANAVVMLDKGNNRLKRPIALLPGSSLRIQNRAVTLTSWVHFRGWYADGTAFDSAADLETI